MSEIVEYREHGVFEWGDPFAMERRIFYGMCVTVALAVFVSSLFAPWRVTTGLLLGGALSLLNHHWLRTSLIVALGGTIEGVRPRIGLARFVLRHFVIFTAIASASLFDLVSTVAALVGLCSFVVAALCEASIQIFFAIVHREEN